jgi:hypothetical protein
MDRETKNLLISIGIGLAILWIFRPKKNNSSVEEKVIADKYQAPKTVSEDDKKIKDDAIIGLQAMREAINNGESVRELDKLKNMILTENNIKIMINKKTKKLRAMLKDGKIIAEEE